MWTKILCGGSVILFLLYWVFSIYTPKNYEDQRALFNRQQEKFISDLSGFLLEKRYLDRGDRDALIFTIIKVKSDISENEFNQKELKYLGEELVDGDNKIEILNYLNRQGMINNISCNDSKEIFKKIISKPLDEFRLFKGATTRGVVFSFIDFDTSIVSYFSIEIQ